MKHLAFILNLLLFANMGQAQQSLLQSGPMVGYSQMLEVKLWVQTTQAALVKIRYTNLANNQERWTNTVATQKAEAFTAHLVADSLEVGQKYSYTVYINNQPLKFDYPTRFQTLPLWQWRTEPPAFRFATGSCAYINEAKYDRPGTPYGADYHIFESIAKRQPDFMLWLGDNIYLREPDWHSWTGIVHRYTHTRSTKQMQALLASTHNYAIWDDHDFGPNNSDRGVWNKSQTTKAFELFWANPSTGVGFGGNTSFFNWNDVDFFLLDNRSFRTPNDLQAPYKTILGHQQLQWLKDALVYSQTSFKFVVMGGQFLNNAGAFESYSNYNFAHERQEIIDFIHNHNIKGVVFLNGDRHHTEMSVLKQDQKPVIYDFTVSPLTSGPNKRAQNENNTLRVQGTLVQQRNFATFEFSGPYKQRQMKVTVFDSNGQKLWDKKLSVDDF